VTGLLGALPLFGERIVITRARSQAADLATRLRSLGADTIEIPVIEMAPLDDYSALDAAIDRISEYDWIVFTSANTVAFFLQRLRVCNRDWRAVHGRICAIGPATAQALQPILPELIPREHSSEGIAAAFRGFEMRLARVLLPRAAEARELIPDALTAMGASVDIVDTYRNVVPAEAESRIQRLRTKPTWITFTSGSTVRNWLSLAGPEWLEGVQIASIGPATSDVIRKYGLKANAEAHPSTIEGLAEAIASLCIQKSALE
jgi:uroporphyrinogen III methyltransferase/synthase